ncbi:PREDICTED: uncharacterized protein LOC105154612 [Acromyrmex echinatior]|uniref:uncharacterized protein LOC105154612 n=1 Tax=Acromyrmex echinatior TaxID=103372 RepID=UPI000580B6B0|nr:PREDICTED: uncharacterized protein LOC105154612 [Acromyrmex echinatior]XP_011068566.1 PREDICTED: uncharacterized protein LOC105154612 [Acromyrmex echinatior]
MQEFNVQFKCLNNLNVCNVNNGDEEKFFIICNNQEITQESRNSLFPQNDYCSMSKYDLLEESLNNNNCTNNIQKSSTNIKTTEVEIPTIAIVNTSHISITATSNLMSIKKDVKRTSTVDMTN